MPVVRVVKDRDYTTIKNTLFRDKRLTWKAKGMLAQLLSLPDEWDYSAKGMETLAADGISATRAALVELEKFGYLTRRAIRSNGKIVDWEYTIYEQPQADFPQVDFPQVEKPQVENRTQLNTKSSITEELKTEEFNPHTPAETVKKDSAAPQPKAAKKKTELTSDQQERFNRFWTVYPRKVSRGQAEKTWAKINPDDALTDTMIQAIDTAKKCDSRFREERYTPHASTWLNGKEWENQYTEQEEKTDGGFQPSTGLRSTLPDYFTG